MINNEEVACKINTFNPSKLLMSQIFCIEQLCIEWTLKLFLGVLIHVSLYKEGKMVTLQLFYFYLVKNIYLFNYYNYFYKYVYVYFLQLFYFCLALKISYIYLITIIIFITMFMFTFYNNFIFM
jgi:hypothetical protein